MIDWSTCPDVERSPERVGGAWTFRGTRLPVATLFDNLAAGATVAEFLEWFQGVTAEQVGVVLAHASRSAGAGNATGTVGTRPFDAARYLAAPGDVAAYLEAALEDGDAAVIATAIADALRSKGMARASEVPEPGVSETVISRDPEVLGGTPVFAGTRVPVVAAFDYLESGDSVENFLDDFPGVSHERLTRMLRLARVSLLGPDDDEPVVRRTDPKRLPRKVRYGGCELEAVPANGVTGMLLSSFDRTWTFRVTHGDGTFSDYRLRHDDMTVTIADDELAAFYSDGDEIGILDHSPEVLGLIPDAPRTIFHTERRPPPTDGRDVGQEILDGVREIKAFERGEGPALRWRRLRKLDEPATDRPTDDPDPPPGTEPSSS